VSVAPTTRADFIESRLRDEILSGRLAPGERIAVERIAETWGVSPTPVRESMRRLAGEGLVELLPQRGGRVPIIDIDAVANLYAVRLLLEPEAIRQSVARCGQDPTWRGRLTEAYRALAKADYWNLASRHSHFHGAVLSLCPNDALLSTIAGLMGRSRLFQAAARYGRTNDDRMREHRALFDAARVGDIEGAVAAQTRHLENTLASLRAKFDSESSSEPHNRR